MGGGRALEWLLEELRFKCGVSALWYHLLCLAEGLRLPALHLPPTTAPPAAAATTDDDDAAREEVLCLRQEPLLTVLARVREVDAGMADAPVIYPVAVAVRQGLRFFQAQVRDALLGFPYLLAQAEGNAAAAAAAEPRELYTAVPVPKFPRYFQKRSHPTGKRPAPGYPSHTRWCLLRSYCCRQCRRTCMPHRQDRGEGRRALPVVTERMCWRVSSSAQGSGFGSILARICSGMRSLAVEELCATACCLSAP